MDVPWGIRHDDVEFAKNGVIKPSDVAIDPLGRKLIKALLETNASRIDGPRLTGGSNEPFGPSPRESLWGFFTGLSSHFASAPASPASQSIS
jgi:hypothetical protein